MRGLLRIGIVVMIMLVYNIAHAATTYYTRKTGSNSNSCAQAQTPATAKLTVAAGLSCLVGGDTLLVGAGTYQEQLLDIPAGGGTEGTRTIVQAEVTGAAIIAPQSGDYTFGFFSWTTLRGFVIDADYKVTRGLGMSEVAHHIRIQDVEIKNPNGQGLALREGTGFHELLNLNVHGAGYGPGGCTAGAFPGPGFCHGIYMSAANVTIDGGRYWGNNGYGMQIYVGNANNTIVRNIRVYDNQATGIGVFRPNTTVTNTLVYNNGGIGIWLKSAGTLASHNTSWGNNGNQGILADLATGYTIRDNITDWLVPGGNTDTNNCYPGDPLFVSVPLNDYHLQAGSPCKNNASDGGDRGVNFTTLDGAADTTAPTVSVTAPAPAATVSGASVAVTATANDAVGVTGVQFKLDGVNLGAEDTTSTYGITWDTTTTTNGSHTLTAVARDAAGNTTTSAGITVTVSNETTPPTVSITAPLPSATVVGTTVAVTANASDNVAVVGVQFKLDGAVLDAEDTSAPYAITWNTTLVADGSHTLTAVARDAAGNTTTSTGIAVTVNNTPLPGGTFYVAPTGDDSRTCATAQNIALPKQTVTSGVTCLAAAGNILLLREGTYVESLDTSATPIVGGTSWAAPTTIAAYPGETVTLRGSSAKPIVIFLRNGAADKFLLFDRLILDAFNLQPSNGFAAMANTHDIRFQNGEIKNSYYELVYLRDTSNIELRNSTIHGSTLFPLISADFSTSNVLIQGNTLHTSPQQAVEADVTTLATNVSVIGNIIYNVGLTGSVGAITLASSGALIRNNVMYGSYTGVVAQGTATGAKLYNNTITGNTSVGVVLNTGATNTEVINNILFGNSAAITNNGTSTTQTTNLATDPLFLNAGAQNYQLSLSSPARDTGTTLAAVVDDLLGVARPSGSAYDIGAYEFNLTVFPGVPTSVAASGVLTVTFPGPPMSVGVGGSASMTAPGPPTSVGANGGTPIFPGVPTSVVAVQP